MIEEEWDENLTLFCGKMNAFYYIDRVVREIQEVNDNGLQEIYVNTKVDDGSSIAKLMKIYQNQDEYDFENFPNTSNIRTSIFSTMCIKRRYSVSDFYVLRNHLTFTLFFCKLGLIVGRSQHILLKKLKKKEIQNQEGAISPKRYFILLVFFMGDETMNNMKKMILSAFFLALGLVMPFLTGQIPEIGGMLLPMHIPVLICGFICGWKYGLLVGFITPLLRTFLFGMPPFLTAVSMAFELATYGATTGFFYQKLLNNKARIYISLLIAMVAGRLVWGAVSMILYGVSGNAFTWQIFIAGAFLNAIPGIILQLILIPVLMFALEKAGVTKIDD